MHIQKTHEWLVMSMTAQTCQKVILKVDVHPCVCAPVRPSIHTSICRQWRSDFCPILHDLYLMNCTGKVFRWTPIHIEQGSFWDWKKPSSIAVKDEMRKISNLAVVSSDAEAASSRVVFVNNLDMWHESLDANEIRWILQAQQLFNNNNNNNDNNQ